MSVCHSPKDLADGLWVHSVGNGNVYCDAGLFSFGRPIQNLLRNKLGVGNDDLDVAIGPNGHISGANPNQIACPPADLHPVPQTDGAVRQQDESRDKVARHGLTQMRTAYWPAP